MGQVCEKCGRTRNTYRDVEAGALIRQGGASGSSASSSDLRTTLNTDISIEQSTAAGG